VLHCWAPLQPAYDNMAALHAKAATQLERLFPNMHTYIPDGNEEEPSSDADDDFEEPEPEGSDAQRARAQAERAEHGRAADTAVATGVPEQRPRRAAAAAANERMDAMEARGEMRGL
jgi:hypothetical protein